MKKFILLLAFSYLLPLTATNFSIADTDEPITKTKEIKLTLVSQVIKNTLIYQTTSKVRNICFFDGTGNRILTCVTPSNSVDVSDLPNGYYRVCFYGEHSSKLSQAIIKKI